MQWCKKKENHTWFLVRTTLCRLAVSMQAEKNKCDVLNCFELDLQCFSIRVLLLRTYNTGQCDASGTNVFQWSCRKSMQRATRVSGATGCSTLHKGCCMFRLTFWPDCSHYGSNLPTIQPQWCCYPQVASMQNKGFLNFLLNKECLGFIPIS